MDPSMSVYRQTVITALYEAVTLMTMNTTAARHIPLVALLTSSPITWRKEHLFHSSVLQRVYLFACSDCIHIRV